MKKEAINKRFPDAYIVAGCACGDERLQTARKARAIKAMPPYGRTWSFITKSGRKAVTAFLG